MENSLNKIWTRLIMMCGILDRTEEEQYQIDCMENYIYIVTDNANKRRRKEALQNEK